jgi:hypothetical protein
LHSVLYKKQNVTGYIQYYKKMVGQTQRPWVRQNLSSCLTQCQLWNSPDIHKAQCCNKSFDISYHWHWTSIIFLTGYRHFHLKKGKVKQGFIYENAQKKVLENFCPGKSLKSPWFCSTKKCMNPVYITASVV